MEKVQRKLLRIFYVDEISLEIISTKEANFRKNLVFFSGADKTRSLVGRFLIKISCSSEMVSVKSPSKSSLEFFDF